LVKCAHDGGKPSDGGHEPLFLVPKDVRGHEMLFFSLHFSNVCDKIKKRVFMA